MTERRLRGEVGSGGMFLGFVYNMDGVWGM